jgi:threonine aldolase
MANQIALLVHTRPGDEVIVGAGSHCAWFEGGGAAALAGVQLAVAGSDTALSSPSTFSAEDVLGAIKPSAEQVPRSSLVIVENTHNLAGNVFPHSISERIAELCRERGLKLHMDGARLWNAASATGFDTKLLAAPFDTVSVCFSKGLGAPVGSALVGSREVMLRARRLRKMLGGGMRQAGILAAGALFGVEHNRERLARDHAAATAFADVLRRVPSVTLAAVQTNIVLFGVQQDAQDLAKRAAMRGVLLHAVGARSLRAVAHLDIGLDEAVEAAQVLCELIAR